MVLFLFLSALQSGSGKFLLNGGMVIGLGVREFRAAGSKIWYSGSEKPIEQIKIDGKTTEPIKVHVSNWFLSLLKVFLRVGLLVFSSLQSRNRPLMNHFALRVRPSFIKYGSNF